MGSRAVRRYCLPSGRYCQGTWGSSVCLKFSAGRGSFLIFAIQSSKRLLRLRLRLPRTFGESPAPALPALALPPPPKLPQFSDTEGRSSSASGGAMTCSHTTLRSSVIEPMRSQYDSSARSSLHRSRGHTLVASSDTFRRWVLASRVKMLLGWSAEVGSLSFDG